MALEAGKVSEVAIDNPSIETHLMVAEASNRPVTRGMRIVARDLVHHGQSHPNCWRGLRADISTITSRSRKSGVKFGQGCQACSDRVDTVAAGLRGHQQAIVRATEKGAESSLPTRDENARKAVARSSPMSAPQTDRCIAIRQQAKSMTANAVQSRSSAYRPHLSSACATRDADVRPIAPLMKRPVSASLCRSIPVSKPKPCSR